MKYIIMCGGPCNNKPLRELYNEPLVARTIRLLRANGITDIAISSHNEQYNQFGVPILKHDNPDKGSGIRWLKCFFPATGPVCYLYGDVFYSPDAIRIITETNTDDIEFFASAPPFDIRYTKQWAEPFAFKVQNVERFFDCVDQTSELGQQGCFYRHPISWELWQVVKNTRPLGKIDYTNYTVINDYTVDIDTDSQARWITDRGIGKL